jgi:hypothetical protein
VPGEDLPHVHQSVDVLRDPSPLGQRVLVLAQDDHLAPLSVADFVAGTGRDVTVVLGTTGPAPLVSRYLIGSVLGRLDEQGVRLRTSEQVTAIEPGRVVVRNVYSHREQVLGDVDSVVLSCTAVPDNALFDELSTSGVDVHVLGDAFAPRRLVWATRQAYELVTAW